MGSQGPGSAGSGPGDGNARHQSIEKRDEGTSQVVWQAGRVVGSTCILCNVVFHLEYPRPPYLPVCSHQCVKVYDVLRIPHFVGTVVLWVLQWGRNG